MNMDLYKAMAATEAKAQYDACAKRLLGNKSILAHILVKAVEDFKDMSPADVETYIEGEPYIAVVPVEPGLTNWKYENRNNCENKGRHENKGKHDNKSKGDNNSKCDNKSTHDTKNNHYNKDNHDNIGNNNSKRLVGFNTETGEINEGIVRFDIVFYVRLPGTGNIPGTGGKSSSSSSSKSRRTAGKAGRNSTEKHEEKGVLSQIIINIEAQKNEPVGYNIMDRAVFYVSRLISSQKGRDFENSNYSDIKRVYSIWICMNMDEDCMSHVHLTKDDILGNHEWKGRLDLLNIVMIGLAKEIPEHSDQYELHRLLGALLSQNLTVNEKIDIIGNEYDIQTRDDLRKEVNTMCNLSEGIEERGIEKGIEKGLAMGIEQGLERGITQGVKKGLEQGTAQIIFTLYKNGLSAEQIATLTDKDIADVNAILEEKTRVLV